MIVTHAIDKQRWTTMDIQTWTTYLEFAVGVYMCQKNNLLVNDCFESALQPFIIFSLYITV